MNVSAPIIPIVSSLSTTSSFPNNVSNTVDKQPFKDIQFASSNVRECINTCTFLNDDIVASGGNDYKMTLHNFKTGKIVQEFPHNGSINSCSFSSRRNFLASGGKDCQLIIRDINHCHGMASDNSNSHNTNQNNNAEMKNINNI